MARTRLGLYGGPRSPYGTFAGKTEEVIVATPDAPAQFGKKFYELEHQRRQKELTMLMRREDEEVLAIVQIIGRILL